MAALTWKNVGQTQFDTGGTDTALSALKAGSSSLTGAAQTLTDQAAKERTRRLEEEAYKLQDLASLQAAKNAPAPAGMDPVAWAKQIGDREKALRTDIVSGQKFELGQKLQPGAEEAALSTQALEAKLRPGAASLAQQQQELDLALQPGKGTAALLGQKDAAIEAARTRLTGGQEFNLQQAKRDFPKFLEAATIQGPDGKPVINKDILDQQLDAANVPIADRSRLIAEYEQYSGEAAAKADFKDLIKRERDLSGTKRLAEFKHELSQRYTRDDLESIASKFTQPDSMLNIFGQEDREAAMGYLAKLVDLPLADQARVMMAGVDGTDFEARDADRMYNSIIKEAQSSSQVAEKNLKTTPRTVVVPTTPVDLTSQITPEMLRSYNNPR